MTESGMPTSWTWILSLAEATELALGPLDLRESDDQPSIPTLDRRVFDEANSNASSHAEVARRSSANVRLGSQKARVQPLNHDELARSTLIYSNSDPDIRRFLTIAVRTLERRVAVIQRSREEEKEKEEQERILDAARWKHMDERLEEVREGVRENAEA